MLDWISRIFGQRTRPADVHSVLVAIIASQYDINPEAVIIDKPFREFGADNGLQDEFNYVEVIQHVEEKLKIRLPDEIVLRKEKVGLELIPASATPRWLEEVVQSRLGDSAAH